MDSDLARRQAAAFDAVAGRFDDVYPHKAGQIIATQWLIDRMPPAARVLDLGCGTGIPTADMIAEAGHKIVGIDVSPRMLALVRRTVPSGRFLQMDIADLDTSLGRFDAAAAFFSLSMLSRSDIPRVIGRLQAVLRPGAPVAIGMPEGDLDHALQPFLDQQLRVTAFPQEDLVATARVAGLQVLDVDVEEYEPALGAAAAERHLYLYCSAP